jgi:phospholipid/cholesterol/gamma-HCH transport system permease protein
MYFLSFIEELGKYLAMLASLFTKPERFSMYWKETMRQMVNIGIGSLIIVGIVSTFVGGVTAVQFSNQIMGLELIPMWWLGYIIRDSMILELAPTITGLLLAGKIGSNISSELGSMRITEQIDALEIMGVNTPAYLIAPKIISGIFVMPILVTIAVFLGIIGGMFAGVIGGYYSTTEYIRGTQDMFVPWYAFMMLIKSAVFGFIICSIAAYYGYNVKGGALAIGEASTKAVVNSCIIIIIANFIIAFLLL